MKDEEKEKEELIDELREMRRRIAQLQASKSGDQKGKSPTSESEVWFRALIENGVSV